MTYKEVLYKIAGSRIRTYQPGGFPTNNAARKRPLYGETPAPAAAPAKGVIMRPAATGGTKPLTLADAKVDWRSKVPANLQSNYDMVVNRFHYTPERAYNYVMGQK